MMTSMLWLQDVLERCGDLLERCGEERNAAIGFLLATAERRNRAEQGRKPMMKATQQPARRKSSTATDAGKGTRKTRK